MDVERVAGHLGKKQTGFDKTGFGEPVWLGFLVQFYFSAKMAMAGILKVGG